MKKWKKVKEKVSKRRCGIDKKIQSRIQTQYKIAKDIIQLFNNNSSNSL